MQQITSFRTRTAALVALVVALSACDDHTDLNSPSTRATPRDAQTVSTLSAQFAITRLDLSSTTLVIDGPIASYTATVSSSTQSFKGLVVNSYFVQQGVRHQIGSQGVPCGFGNTNCTYTNLIQASGLVPGAAMLELELLDASGVVLNTRDVSITLVAGQTMSSPILSSTSIVVDGPNTPFSLTLVSQTAAVSGVVIQGFLVQSGVNSARRAAGSQVIECGAGAGVLPTGACTVASVIVASNTSPGTGTLIAGPATFEVDLVVNGNVIATQTVPVSIVSGATITGLRLDATSDTLVLEGAAAPYTALLQNVASTVSGISMQGFVVQGTARRFAGGTVVSCGANPGVLPTGKCTMAFQFSASNNTAGTGTLVTGPASFELQLVDGAGKVLSTATVPIFVVHVGKKKPHSPPS